MAAFVALFLSTLGRVLASLVANWPYLALSVLLSVALKLTLDAEKVSRLLLRHRRAGIAGATAVAVATPLCSCGTMAVVLGMMASMVPWAPVVAFLVASPLTSPEELLYSAGLFGWPFALTFFGASIVLGLAGGLAAMLLESRGLLANQARWQTGARAGNASSGVPATRAEKLTVATLARGTLRAGCRLTVMFVGFAFLGYFVNDLIPAGWVAAVFGNGRVYAVPVAATLGLPFYVNTEASLPLVRSMLDSGMSQGAALAFLITGAGTSIGAIAGALSIARLRIIGLVVGTLWVGAILFGVGYDVVALGAP